MKYLRNLFLAMALALSLSATLGAGISSATTLEVGGVAKNSSVEFTATLKAGTSLVLKDEFGTTTVVCTTSEFKGKTEGTFTGASVGGKASTWQMENCSHTYDTLANGSLSFTWTSGTNGELKSSGTETLVFSTFFGAHAICKTGTGTKLGTVTGVSSGNATIDINATIGCGILGNASLTGTYTLTSPTGMGVVS